MRAVRDRLHASLVQVGDLSGGRWACDVICRGHLRRVRCFLLTVCGKLHLDLQFFSFLRGQWLDGWIVVTLLASCTTVLRHAGHARTRGWHVWVLLLRVAMRSCIRQGLMVTDRLDLTLGDLLDLL